MNHFKHKGLTLFQLLLSISIIAVIAGGILALDIPAQQRNDLDTTRDAIVQSLYSAQMRARGVDGDSAWGVSLQNNTITLFKGSSYATRDTTRDETTEIPGTLVATGLSEIVFTKLSGNPTPTGTITLTSKTNEMRTLSINTMGLVE